MRTAALRHFKRPSCAVIQAGSQSPCAAIRSVDQRADLAQVKFGGGVRVEHRGVIDVVAVLVPSGRRTVSSCTFRLVRISAMSCGGMSLTVVGWMPFASTRQGTSTAAPCGQLRDVAAGWHIAVNHRGLAGDDRIHDRGGIFVAGRHLDPRRRVR